MTLRKHKETSLLLKKTPKAKSKDTDKWEIVLRLKIRKKEVSLMYRVLGKLEKRKTNIPIDK